MVVGSIAYPERRAREQGCGGSWQQGEGDGLLYAADDEGVRRARALRRTYVNIHRTYVGLTYVNPYVPYITGQILPRLRFSITGSPLGISLYASEIK